MKEGKFRIYDEETIKKLELLFASKGWRSMNELYQQAIKIGASELYRQEIEHKEKNEYTKEKEEMIVKAINYLKISVDELFITVGMIKHLVTTIYNIDISLLEGEMVDKTLIETGAFSVLPKELQEIENSLYEKHKKGKE